MRQYLNQPTIWYIIGVAAIFGFTLGFIVGRGSVAQSENAANGVNQTVEESVISKQEAVERAKEWLTQSGTSFENREVTVSLKGNKYKVVFPPPKDTLGGDFTLTVDANTGEVLEAIIER